MFPKVKTYKKKKNYFLKLFWKLFPSKLRFLLSVIPLYITLIFYIIETTIFPSKMHHFM